MLSLYSKEKIEQIAKSDANFTFARLVDGTLIAKGIKRYEFAQQVGCATKTISRICNGDKMEKKVAIAIGIVLGLCAVDIDKLIYLQGYALSPVISPDKQYIEVIDKISGSGAKRLCDCNEELRNLRVMDKDLLENFHRYPSRTKKK